jgi:hypothetical protein
MNAVPSAKIIALLVNPTNFNTDTLLSYIGHSYRLCGSFGPCRIGIGRVTGAARRQCHRPVDAID